MAAQDDSRKVEIPCMVCEQPFTHYAAKTPKEAVCTEDLEDLAEFYRIHALENDFRRQIGSGATLESYQELVSLKEEDFKELRHQIDSRVQRNYQFRDPYSFSLKSPNKTNYLYPRGLYYTGPEVSSFVSVLKKLPERLQQTLVLAGGAVLSMITGSVVADYDLFLVEVPGVDTVAAIRDLLEIWEPNISRISRSPNAITISMRPSGKKYAKYLKLRRKAFQVIQSYKKQVAAMNSLLIHYRTRHVYTDFNDFYNKLEKYREKISELRGMLSMAGKDRNYKVQIILRQYRAPTEIVHGFDLASSGFLYHMGGYYATRGAMHALKTMTNYISLDRASTTYNYRLVKYMARGFRIFSPKALTLEHRREAQTLTLGTLRYKAREYYEGSLVGLYALSKRKHIKCLYTDEKGFSYTDYSVYIEDEKFSKINQVTVRDDEINWYSFCPKYVPMDNIFRLRAEFLEKCGRMKWTCAMPDLELSIIKVDPGRQWTGSFHPQDLSMEDWAKNTLDLEPRIRSIAQTKRELRMARNQKMIEGKKESLLEQGGYCRCGKFFGPGLKSDSS